MLAEAIAAAVELAIGHVSGLSVAVMLLVGAHYLGYLKHVSAVSSHLRLVAVLVAGLVLTGALDVGELMGVTSWAIGTAIGLLGGFLP